MRRKQLALLTPFCCVLAGNQRTRSCFREARSTDWWDNIVPHLTGRRWRCHFRVSRELYVSMCNDLREELESPGRNKIGKLSSSTVLSALSFVPPNTYIFFCLQVVRWS